MYRWLMELGGAAGAFAAADRAGLLAALGRGGVTAESAAASLSLDPRGTALVLDVLVANDIAVRREGRYEASDALQMALRDELLAPGRFTALWLETEAMLRTGSSAIHTRNESERETAYAQFVQHLGRRFEFAAVRLANELALPHGVEVLDVGAGSGVWSLEIAARSGGVATALDLAEVLERFRERAASKGLGDRAKTIAGSYHQAAVPGGAFDAAVLANVLHLETAPQAEALVARVAPAVKRNGAMIVVDMIEDGSQAEARMGASYALHLALRVPGSRVHPEHDYRRWLSAAGFPEMRRVALDASMPGLCALIATRS